MILNSKVLGRGERVLIILHGLFGSLDNWYGIAKVLSMDYQVHILDQRNHGKSFQHEIHNYDVMSQDLYKYIKSHQIKNPIILFVIMKSETILSILLNLSSISLKFFLLLIFFLYFIESGSLSIAIKFITLNFSIIFLE